MLTHEFSLIYKNGLSMFKYEILCDEFENSNTILFESTSIEFSDILMKWIFYVWNCKNVDEDDWDANNIDLLDTNGISYFYNNLKKIKSECKIFPYYKSVILQERLKFLEKYNDLFNYVM